jgi:ribosomal protein S18 acetylase RimI-like enzyme
LLCRCSDSAGASAWLEVRASNVGAVALYEQLDFTKRATRRKYYSDGEDAIVMCKELIRPSSSSNHRP